MKTLPNFGHERNLSLIKSTVMLSLTSKETMISPNISNSSIKHTMKITSQYWQADYAFCIRLNEKRHKCSDLLTNACKLKIKIVEGEIVL